VEYLVQSSKLGDFLAVAVNSDESVRTLKGEGRPINNERDRAYLVAALACVSATVIFRGPRLASEIRALRPDVYTKAGDYSLDRLEQTERAALTEVGARVVFTSFAEGVSTTGLLQRIHPATQVIR
jgi:rfaE bifunctional protein nucleotidyltransferase chain/domain